jgi:hypothetical protein
MPHPADPAQPANPADRPNPAKADEVAASQTNPPTQPDAPQTTPASLAGVRGLLGAARLGGLLGQTELVKCMRQLAGLFTSQPAPEDPSGRLDVLKQLDLLVGQLRTVTGHLMIQSTGRQDHATLGFTNMADTMSRISGKPSSQTRSDLNWAERLEQLPIIKRAALEGELTRAQTQSIIQTIDVVRSLAGRGRTSPEKLVPDLVRQAEQIALTATKTDGHFHAPSLAKQILTQLSTHNPANSPPTGAYTTKRPALALNKQPSGPDTTNNGASGLDATSIGTSGLDTANTGTSGLNTTSYPPTGTIQADNGQATGPDTRDQDAIKGQVASVVGSRDVVDEKTLAYESRYLSVRTDGFGGVEIHGRLGLVEGEQFEAVLMAYARRIHTRMRRARGEHRKGRVDWGKLRADALTEIVHDLVAGPNLVPSLAGDQPRLTVTVTLDQLRDGLDGAMTGNFEHLSAGELRRLACDCDVIPAVLGSPSQVLDLGFTTRLVPSGLRRALEARDRGCVFPGCDTPASLCQAHHITPWANGGPTAVDNTVLLCHPHHNLVEPLQSSGRTGQLPDNPNRWQVALDSNGVPYAIPPAIVDPQRRPVYHRHHKPPSPPPASADQPPPASAGETNHPGSLTPTNRPAPVTQTRVAALTGQLASAARPVVESPPWVDDWPGLDDYPDRPPF